MAYTMLLLPRAAKVTAALLAGGALALRPQVAHAQEHYSKKPIYDDLDWTPSRKALPAPSVASSITLVDNDTAADAVTPEQERREGPTVAATLSSYFSASSSPPSSSSGAAPTPTERLAHRIRLGRLFLYRQSCAAEDTVNRVLSRAFELERSFTSTIAALAPPRESGEKLVPGLTYVVVAAMAGSIVTRRRGFLLRVAGPLAFGVGAGCAVIPVTMGNVSALLARYESRFPAVERVHAQARERVESGYATSRAHAKMARHKVTETITGAREAVEGWVRKGK